MARKNRIFVFFFTFRLSLLASSQVLISAKSLISFYCKSARLFELRVRLESSAYILGTEYRGHAGRSFIQTKKNSNPRIDPRFSAYDSLGMT